MCMVVQFHHAIMFPKAVLQAALAEVEERQVVL